LRGNNSLSAASFATNGILFRSIAGHRGTRFARLDQGIYAPTPGRRSGTRRNPVRHYQAKESAMDNYEDTLETGRPQIIEDGFTKSVEDYTAAVPSSAYLGIALGAMALSLAFQLTGRGKLANFIAQWVPAWLIIGVYNKLVKIEGHDQADRGGNRGYTN
jgi:hypothetical protein